MANERLNPSLQEVLDIAHGGTGANTAEEARANLEVAAGKNTQKIEALWIGGSGGGVEPGNSIAFDRKGYKIFLINTTGEVFFFVRPYLMDGAKFIAAQSVLLYKGTGDNGSFANYVSATRYLIFDSYTDHFYFRILKDVTEAGNEYNRKVNAIYGVSTK